MSLALAAEKDHLPPSNANGSFLVTPVVSLCRCRTFTPLSGNLCAPSGSSHGPHNIAINSGRSNPLWVPGSLLYVEAGARRSSSVGCALVYTYGTHGHLLQGEERPMCSRCNESVTVAHVLLRCRRYARKRTAHLRRVSSTATVKHLLADDSPWVQDSSLFSFIHDINFPVIFSHSLPAKTIKYVCMLLIPTLTTVKIRNHGHEVT